MREGKAMKYLLPLALAGAVVLSLSAQGEEVTLIAPGGVRAAITELIVSRTTRMAASKSM